MSNASVVSFSAPAQVPAGAPFMASVTFKNTGADTWGAGYNVGAANPQDNLTWADPSRYDRMPAGVTVPPGGQYTFTLRLVAPTVVGSYDLACSMVHDGFAWFGAIADLGQILVCAPMAAPVFPGMPFPILGAEPVCYNVFKRQNAIDTVPVPRWMWWPNPAGIPIKVTYARVFVGVSVGCCPTDVGLWLFTGKADGSNCRLILSYQEDHYAERSVPSQVERELLDPRSIDADEGLWMLTYGVWGGSLATFPASPGNQILFQAWCDFTL